MRRQSIRCFLPALARHSVIVVALDLKGCSLAGVPEDLSALTSLSSLDLNENYDLAGGWQHLRPLRQLSALDFRGCSLSEVPHELSHLGIVIQI